MPGQIPGFATVKEDKIMAQSAGSPSTGALVDQEAERGLWPWLKYVARLLWRDKSGLLGLIMFSMVLFAAVFAPVIAPHDPIDQNRLI